MPPAASSSPSETPRNRRWAVIRGAIYFVLFLVLGIFLESHDQWEWPWSESSCDAPSHDENPPFYDHIYSAFLRSASSDTSSQVRVVSIGGDLSNIQQNVCDARTYLADLIRAVAAQAPKAIVIDKYFSSGICKDNPDATETLLSALQSLRIPVVVGEATNFADKRLDDSCLLANQPLLNFNSENVHSGLLRLNANKEQIPLQWRVRASEEQAHPVPKDSLALVMAKIATRRDFRSLLNDARQPYARLDGKSLHEISSTALLCAAGSYDVRQRWSLDCSSPVQKIDLNDRIVVIGAQSEIDHWVVLGKRMWGYQLQALYIDALLTGRYLRASSDLPIYLFFGFLVMLEGVPVLARWLCELKKRKVPRLLRAPAWIMIFSVLVFALVFTCFYLAGYLPPLLMLSGVVIACITRLVVLGLEGSGNIIAPEEENLHR